MDAHEGRQPRDKPISCPLEYPQEDGQERTAESKSHEPSLQQVCYENLGCGLVEAVPFLNDECAVQREWNGWDGRQ